jgi:hypothetical protein
MKVKDSDRFPSVQWISYHLPKTAGTSFYHSLLESFGKSHVHTLYGTELALKMSRGEPVWAPKSAKVIHGHFKPRPQHLERFSESRLVTWVRDPIERAWSNLRHWLTHDEGSKFTEFKEKYMKGEKKTDEELFNCLVSDKFFWDITEVYQIAFEYVKPERFAFVGRVEEYTSELQRLSVIMDVELKEKKENTNSHNRTLPFKKSDYFHAFEKEYDFLRKWYDKDYPFE